MAWHSMQIGSPGFSGVSLPLLHYQSCVVTVAKGLEEVNLFHFVSHYGAWYLIALQTDVGIHYLS